MLPRISAALSELVSPITSVTRRVPVQANQGTENYKEKPQDPPHKKKRGEPNPPQDGESAKVIPFPSALASTFSSGQKELSVSQALLQIMSLFRDQKATLLRWLGTRSYQSAASQQKKTAKIRHGTIFDKNTD